MTKPWPPCVGTYERGHTSCDGNPKGVDPSDRAACAWRDRCGGLMAYMADRQMAVSDYLDKRDPGQESDGAFSEHCKEWASIYEIAEGLPKEKKPARLSVGQRGTSSKSWQAARVFANQAVDEFIEKVLDEFGSRRSASGGIPVVGQFVITDRRGNSRYVAIYCIARSGRQVPLLTARPKAIQGGVEVRLPVTADEWALRPRGADWDATAVDDGAFRCSLGVLDRVKLGQLARVLKTMEKTGDIKLPEVLV